MKKMLKWLLAGAAVLGLGAILPFQSRDVAQLVPVEALVVTLEQGQVAMNGGDCQGRGDTWEEAWQDLQQSAEGHVFLGTAEQVILAGGAVKLLPQAALSQELRPAACVCVSLGQTPDPEKAARYLSTHNSGVTLQRVRAALQKNEKPELPVLVTTEGGLRLYGAEHR